MAPVASPRSHPLLPLLAPFSWPACIPLASLSLPWSFPSRLCTSACKVTDLPGWSAVEVVHQVVQDIVAAAAREGVPGAEIRV